MNSRLVAGASAGVLMLGGVALLFMADDILPRLIAGFPPAAGWVGQLVGSGWLAIAALNWLSRGARLGGIYGRPIVMANAVVYFVSTMVLSKVASRSGAAAPIVTATVVFAAFAGLYGWLLFRGPFRADR
jgi:hypothetical protein